MPGIRVSGRMAVRVRLNNGALATAREGHLERNAEPIGTAVETHEGTSVGGSGDDAARIRRLEEYHEQLAAKYDRARWHPWRPSPPRPAHAEMKSVGPKL